LRQPFGEIAALKLVRYIPPKRNRFELTVAFRHAQAAYPARASFFWQTLKEMTKCAPHPGKISGGIDRPVFNI